MCSGWTSAPFRWIVHHAAACTLIWGQLARNANLEYGTVELRRKAAAEMEHRVRPAVERTGDLIRSLGLRPGDRVADVGGGVGYLLPYLIAAVGPTGAVIAEDIHEDFVEKARARILRAGWQNARAVLGTETDPALEENSLDAVLVLDAYHHFDYPAAMLDGMWRGLKAGGRLFIVDYYRSRKHPGATDADLKNHVRADRDEVIREVTERRFQLLRQFDHLPHEYVLVFAKAPVR